ncbi:MAG: fibronectin-binding domain-containing protein [Candidatus Verstraetearchaeota archaeon]|nr:fibronectin-binding domain-containing protein [Candidatus Verstraetearchaeota archaeon]
MKSYLSSIDLLAIIRELNSILISTRIENIYNLDNFAFLFRFHKANGINFDLIFELGKRINLSNFKYPLPSSPSPSVARIRSLIIGAQIVAINQIDLDRIICIILKSNEEKILKLYLELFEKGNIIITDEFDKIIFALYQRRMKDRCIIIGETYKPPPIRGKSIYEEINYDDISNEDIRNLNVVKVLSKYYNLPPEFIEEVLVRCNISSSTLFSEINNEALQKFIKTARSIIEEIKSSALKPNIVVKNGERISVQPIEFISLPYDRIYFDSFNNAVDEYFSSFITQKLSEKQRKPLDEKIKEFENIIERQKKYLKELEEKQIKSKKIGEIILTNLDKIQALIDHVINMRKKNVDWEEIKKLSPIEILEINPSKGTLKTIINNQELEIDFKISATDNMNKFFSEYKEISKKINGLINAINETERKINELKKGLEEINKLIIVKEMKKEWYERFRWTFSSQGFLIIGGKDAKQNEILVKKYMDEKDVFVHSDVPGGSVVIIKSNGLEVPEETKREAVSFAVIYSKAWKAGLSAADGYWVMANQVSKKPPSGEFLKKGSFMIYGERNYIRNVPLILFLGVKIVDKEFKIIVGNENFVKNNSIAFVKLVPGDLKGEILAKKIKELLIKRASNEYREIINAIPNNEILSKLPPGGALPL